MKGCYGALEPAVPRYIINIIFHPSVSKVQIAQCDKCLLAKRVTGSLRPAGDI